MVVHKNFSVLIACADNESRPRLTGNVKTRTDPPFFIALRYDRFDIVKVLLLNGAQPLNRNMVLQSIAVARISCTLP
jgi:hypothetical protein